MTPSGPLGGLDAVIADGLADLANASLGLDPASQARLAGLEGYRVQISVDFPAPIATRDYGLTVSAGRLRFFPGPLEAPNVIVRGPPADLTQWLLGGNSTPAASVRIDGDGTVLQELTTLLRGFRPDLGAPLGRLLGHDMAESLLGTAELALATVRSALEGARTTARQGAAQAFVDRAQAERFLDELDDLRLRVDRLAARVDAEVQRRTSP